MSTVEASATADAVEAAVRTKTYSPRTIPVFGVVTQHEDSQVPPGCSRGGEGRKAPGQPGGIQDQSEPAGTETRGAGPWGACGWRWGGWMSSASLSGDSGSVVLLERLTPL